MKRAGLLILTIVIVILAGAVAYGVDTFGMPVYPGGTYDQQASKLLKDMMKLDAACYRTKDSIAKVVEFYKEQDGLRVFNADKNGGFFRKGDIDVTVQSPWMDMETGKMNKDTLISIVKTSQ